MLLYSGDILMTYAALGLVLYALRGLSPQQGTGCCLVVGLALLLLGYGMLTVAFARPATPAQYAPEVAQSVAGSGGGFLSVVGARLHEFCRRPSARSLHDMLAAFSPHPRGGQGGPGGAARPGPEVAQDRRRQVGLPVGLAGGGDPSVLCERAAGQPLVPGRARGVAADRARAPRIVVAACSCC
ncbi:hypothetical protein [Streptomyces griseorubiginosus]